MSMRRAIAGVVGLSAVLLSPWSRAAEPTKEECVAANESAQDLRQAGKLHEARKLLTYCVSPSCPPAVRADCAERLKELEAVQPSLAFEVKDGAGTDLSAVRVTMDGQPLAARLDGSARPIDPGLHRFLFESEGFETTEKVLLVREGDKERHEHVVLEYVRTVAAPPVTSPPVVPAAVGGDIEAPNGIGGRRILAFVVGGVGAAALAVGIGTGIAATSKHSTLQGECPHAPICPSSASGDLDSFHTLRTASTVTYVIGAAGLAGGGVLFLTAPSRKTSTPTAWVYPWMGLACPAGRLGGRF